ncbi:MAG: hypothetical protein J6Y10_07825 [Lachnospiraceae bacterium]|nr:hypothetical protein [Lachnospiraceae bacterium]
MGLEFLSQALSFIPKICRSSKKNVVHPEVIAFSDDVFHNEKQKGGVTEDETGKTERQLFQGVRFLGVALLHPGNSQQLTALDF